MAINHKNDFPIVGFQEAKDFYEKCVKEGKFVTNTSDLRYVGVPDWDETVLFTASERVAPFFKVRLREYVVNKSWIKDMNPLGYRELLFWYYLGEIVSGVQEINKL